MIRVSTVFFLLGICVIQPSQAQQGDLQFSAGEIQDISLRYSGNTSNWPLVVGLAEHDVTSNSFTLSQADVLQLQNFSTISSTVDEHKLRVQDLIAEGAAIFATQVLDSVKQTLADYYEAIKDGELENATRLGSTIPERVDLLEQTLQSNRVVDVEAQLTKKDGNVDKRRGLLGSWLDAVVGDLFKESDGLKTYPESYANLYFTDGSNVVVNPNTVAVIRKSRIDRLDQSSDTEITLENGGLLAKLSASGKDRSNYILNAGPSTSQLKTQNFYAEAEGERKVKLTNYDGEAIVNANDVTISIKKNEGTVIEEGKPPLDPVKLLDAPSPAWSTADTVIYRESILFPFTAVDKSESYHVQYSNTADFNDKVIDITTTQTSVNLNNLPLGMTFVRVQATDSLGLNGPYSEVVRVYRNNDNKPPPLFIDKNRNNIIFTLLNQVTITGVTEPEAKLTVNGRSVEVSSSGRFSISKSDLETRQTLTIISKDNTGNQTKKELQLIHLTKEDLFDLNIRGGSGTNPITVNSTTLTLSGMAYPSLSVIIENGKFSKVVRTDSKGRWGTTFTPTSEILNITFSNRYTDENYFSESYTLELQ
ncbi:MAG: hypothetical protein FH748_10035 [Balneolaceae bacterium]|nr:hypothetical protein [Balneolaceae bacterium]